MMRSSCAASFGESPSEAESPGLSGPLYQVEEVPEHFHELFILGGYRHPKSSARQCILSVFDATNETLNFWTHFLPSWYIMYILKGLAETLDFKHDSYTWPLLSYMFSCCVFPLASAVAHTFNTMSDHARDVCFFLDYAALSLFSFATAVAYRAYVFPPILQNTVYSDLYLYGAMANGVVCTFVSCQSRFMKPSITRKLFRLGSFAMPYFYDSIPVAVRLAYCSSLLEFVQSLYFRHFCFAFAAVFLYASHLPERWHPGKFDIIGHSHQLFHVFAILATLDQIQAVLQDMQQRRVSLKAAWEFSALKDSVGVTFLLLVINTCIILIFTWRLLRKVKKAV